jgi:hypothetical protein
MDRRSRGNCTFTNSSGMRPLGAYRLLGSGLHLNIQRIVLRHAMSRRPKAVVLLGGGMDSCATPAVAQIADSPHTDERVAVPERRMEVPLVGNAITPTYVPFRNAHLLAERSAGRRSSGLPCFFSAPSRRRFRLPRLPSGVLLSLPTVGARGHVSRNSY